MTQQIKAIKVEFLSAEIIVSKDDNSIGILLSFQDENENIINFVLNNTDMKDLFKGIITVYCKLGCKASQAIKDFLEDLSDDN